VSDMDDACWAGHGEEDTELQMGDQVKKASIVSIGNEVVGGRTVDTNAAHISRELLLSGVPVVGVYVVGDRTDAIVRAFRLAAEEAEVVIATGGLGPTDDDVTRQALAEFLGVELVLREDLLAHIRDYFTRRGLEMAEKNAIQACVPESADPLPNDCGTAPGIAARKGETLLFALPGVPWEMEQMLEVSVLPRLRTEVQNQAIVVRRLRCFGAGESTIAEMLGDAMERGRNPLVNCTASAGVITLEIVATGASRSGAEAMVGREEASLRQRLGDVVYGIGEETLAEVVGRTLARRGQTLATAESCTGGLLAKLITDVPGASRYFARGWVTYSNEAKIDELGVSAELLAEHGAVSEPVAEAMARGARCAAGTDYAIGITGIAGPDGGSEQRPIGLVYIAVDYPGGTDVFRYLFSQGRHAIRLRTARTALDILRRRLKS
jgi:nicotinamide-nucleotide amidase